MRTELKYEILKAESAHDIKIKVNYHIKLGWRSLGNVTVSRFKTDGNSHRFQQDVLYVQAITREDKPKESGFLLGLFARFIR